MDADTPDTQAVEPTDSRRLCMHRSDAAPALRPFKLNDLPGFTASSLAPCEQKKNIAHMTIRKFIEQRPLPIRKSPRES
jgi:hypothetical protein